MGLTDTMHSMAQMLEHLSKDLVKAAKGNKAASQRVRTGSIKLEKVAKTYRKESVAEERSGGHKKRKMSAKTGAAKKAAPKKAAPKKAAKKAAPKKAVKKAAPKKAAPKKAAMKRKAAPARKKVAAKRKKR